MFELFKKYILETLLSDGINLQDYNYKKLEQYKKIKNNRVFGFKNYSMTLEMFIERYLLNSTEVYDTYESKFEMGSQYEFDEDECDDIAVAKEIISLSQTKEALKNEDIDAEAEDFVKKFYRDSGLVSRLKTYLNFDLEAFETKDKQYKCERCKILYLFYILENIYFPKTNVLQLLSKPSMENIDNSSLDMNTYNANIIKMIKDSLEKELPLTVLEEIKTEIPKISNFWESVLYNTQALMDFLYMKEIKYNLNNSIRQLQSDLGKKELEHTTKYTDSPIEILYLRIIQHEFLGNVTDIDFVNNIQKNDVQNAPPEFVKEMKKMYYNKIDINNVEDYINDNALRLSKYVYLKPKTDKKEVQKIRNSKSKFPKWLEFCKRARPLQDITKLPTELQIVSFLQAVILDNSSETFEYTFHGYEKHFKHMPNVQAALKNEKHIPDALQIYWVRKVMDRWYANLGRYDERLKLRKLERACDNILKEILNRPTLHEMLELHKFYMGNKAVNELIITKDQIDAINIWENALSQMDFIYIDDHYSIRHVFQYPPNFFSIYSSLIMTVDTVILYQQSAKNIKLQTYAANGLDAIVLDFTLAFDYINRQCVMQNFSSKSFVTKSCNLP